MLQHDVAHFFFRAYFFIRLRRVSIDALRYLFSSYKATDDEVVESVEDRDNVFTAVLQVFYRRDNQKTFPRSSTSRGSLKCSSSAGFATRVQRNHQVIFASGKYGKQRYFRCFFLRSGPNTTIFATVSQWQLRKTWRLSING